jgi:transcription initiation factor TFIID subunit 1
MPHGGDSNLASAINTPIEHRSRASSPTSASKFASSGDTPSRVRGRKVLKRTTRVVEEDGTETVRIEFIVDDKQVARFQAKQHRQDRLQKADERNLLRKRKRALALENDAPGSNSLDVAKRRKQLQEELKQLQRTEEHNKDYVEMLEREGEAGLGPGGTPQKGAGVRCTQCGQVGHMRTNRSCPLYMADGGGGVTSDASGTGKKVRKSGSDEVERITVNLTELREGARKHEAEKKRKRIQEQKEQAEMYKRPYANTVAKQSRSRMPVSHLNGNLSVVIEKLMDMPESELFRAAVDANAVKDYYMIIKQPMDLGAIKKKIDDVQYDSMRDFIKDLELIVNNSKIYNGDPARSLITANAVKILKRAQEELATLNAEGGTPTAADRG